MHVVYDEETYPNFFCIIFKRLGEPGYLICEISARRNDAWAIAAEVPKFERMIGFNNVNFDYPILHYLLQAVYSGEAAQLTGEQLAGRLHQLCEAIIGSQGSDRWKYQVWERDRIVPQLDLYLIHHLDNRAKSTGLKALQFAMHSPRMRELPFPPGTVLTPEQMDVVIEYGCNDVAETERFADKSQREIEFREGLGQEWWNYNDTKIGKQFLCRELEKVRPGCTKLQTKRDFVRLGDVILPYVNFQTEPFQRTLATMRDHVVPGMSVKESFPSHSAFLCGFSFDFGVGGLHGSVHRRAIYEDDHREVLDVDVTSYYPRLAIVNRFHPKHLGEAFCDVYSSLFDQRQLHAKGTRENQTLKLALNGVFGDSGNQHSPFFDVAFMLSITVNGQLLLCMLAESLLRIQGMEIIQANTDGLTLRFPRMRRALVEEVLQWWQWGTALQLEQVNYRRMWIRDVNNYVAESTKGKVKRKGAYEYELEWWKDPSALCVPRAAEAGLLRGTPVREFLTEHLQQNPWDFLIRGKAPKNCDLMWGPHKVQNTTRYYVSTEGAPLVKVMPPLAGKTERRLISQQKGQKVVICDEFDGRPPRDVNIEWYAREAEKLLIAA
jgi:hypothetical protein